MPDLLHSVRDALAPRYRVDRRLGRGGMATVFMAESIADDRLVAVKVLRPEVARFLGPDRFRREVEFLRRLHHPGIVPVLESGEAGALLYLVMPYVAGENLRMRLQREGQLPLRVVLEVARDVAAALDYAHGRNVLHRDIKPENVLLDESRSLVCDFGLARAIDRAALEPLSSSGLVIGTPAYMSPEQAMAQESLGPACDIYALGCVLYEMLTGEPPFTGPTAQAVIARHLSQPPRSILAVRPDLPARVEAAVFAALAKTPGERPGSGARMIERLGA
ncbi:MAG TPA: serine/threonine-protein kinase [Gemmatimonadales bacterium]|nr:serine/threonine-protein kinase [Gemmatimonadales bacterium]